MSDYSPRPILVTGSSGFLGSHVVTELCRLGLGGRVHLMLRSEPNAESLLGLHFRDQKLNLEDLKPRIHYVDFKDQQKFKDTLENLKNLSREWIVIHLAAIINPQGDEKAQEEVNYQRTIELLEWTNENGKRFIYTSSIVAFGGSPCSRVRSEADYDNYHWLNRLDSYSTSKRKAHDKILQTAKVGTVVLCPGIIHGAYEHKKSSRAHLETILSGKVRWVPGSKGAFVALDSVGQAIIIASTADQFDKGVHVRLINDVCLSYTEYFQLYRDCAGKEKITLHAVPKCFVYPVALAYVIARTLGFKVVKLRKAVQAFLSYDFKTDRGFEEGKATLKQGITESFLRRG